MDCQVESEERLYGMISVIVFIVYKNSGVEVDR